MAGEQAFTGLFASLVRVGHMLQRLYLQNQMYSRVRNIGGMSCGRDDPS